MDTTRYSHTKRSNSEKKTYRMISLICGIQNTTKMNLSMKQKQTQRHREQTCGCQEGGEVEERGVGIMALVDANYYI